MKEAKSQTCQSKKPSKDPEATDSLTIFPNPKETSLSKHIASGVCAHMRTPVCIMISLVGFKERVTLFLFIYSTQ